MADDYIGKKMDDYKRGVRTNVYRPKFTPMGHKPGFWTIKFPPKSVFLTDGVCELGQEIVRTLRDIDCRVSFCGSDSKNGQQLAQSCGAQFICNEIMTPEEAITRVIKYRGMVDILIDSLPCCSLELYSKFIEHINSAPGRTGRIIKILTPSEVLNGVSADSINQILDMTSGSNVTVNSLKTIAPVTDMAYIVVFLCSPATESLNRVMI